MNNLPIGIFDSGIGGLSVVAEFRKLCPSEDIIYFADTLNYPYGTKSTETVNTYFRNDIEFLKKKGVKAALCACSTASVIALPFFKDSINLHVTGMFNEELVTEVKKKSISDKIGLIATELTVKARGFEKLFEKANSSFYIKSEPATLLVEAVTNGDLSPDIIMPIINKLLSKIGLNDLGALIIGCTHFYHVIPELKKALNGIKLIEPSKVAVTCMYNYLKKNNLLHSKQEKCGRTYCYVSGDIEDFKHQIKKLEMHHNIVFIDYFIHTEEVCYIENASTI